MSKKKKRYGVTLTPPMLKQAEQEVVPSNQEVVEAYNEAAKLCLQTILVQNIPPGRAALMIATRAFSLLTGRQSYYQHEVLQSAQILLTLWATEDFIPPEYYPYTVGQTIVALQADNPQNTPGMPDHTDVEVELPVQEESSESVAIEPRC